MRLQTQMHVLRTLEERRSQEIPVEHLQYPELYRRYIELQIDLTKVMLDKIKLE